MTDTRTDWSETGAAEDGKKRGRRGRKAEKAPEVKAEKAEKVKAEKVKAEKAPKQKRQKVQKVQKEVRTPALMSMLTGPTPSREELERQAAMEFSQVVSPSMEMLKAAVPEANSPEEAWRAIESKLGPAPKDPEAELPEHPIWQGDALVYQQLRRHYGRPHIGGSFRRGWSPGGGGGMPPILGA